MGPLSVTTHPSPVSPVESRRTTVDSPAPRFLERNDHPAIWNRTTYIALLMLTALWAAQVYTTWAAWGNLTIDSGHEMYIPALLAQGKVLYRDVWFPYGPASPYINSYLFRLFGVKLNVLYWAGSLSALGSAIFLYLTGMRLSSWLAGWTAGAVLLLQALSLPFSAFLFPTASPRCMAAWVLIPLACRKRDRRHELVVGLGRGTVAAAALLFKPEFGTASYATLVPLRGRARFSQRSWGRIARDALAILPGVVSCGLVSFGWCPLEESSSLHKKISWVGQLPTL